MIQIDFTVVQLICDTTIVLHQGDIDLTNEFRKVYQNHPSYIEVGPNSYRYDPFYQLSNNQISKMIVDTAPQKYALTCDGEAYVNVLTGFLSGKGRMITLKGLYECPHSRMPVLLNSAASKQTLPTTLVQDLQSNLAQGQKEAHKVKAYITQIIENKSGVRINGNVGYEEKIRRTAITVKHDLSDPSKSRSIARVELNGRIYTTPISKTVFDEITAHILRQTLDCLQDVYDKHSASCKIDEIICVGGSSNMLQVEEGLLKRFPKCKIRLYEPEHAVVNGATIYANMPQINVLKDVASFSYGTDSNTHYGYRDNKEIVSNIIIKGASLPVTNSRSYCPVREGQEVVAFRIYESEHMDADYDFANPDKRFVGTVELRLPPKSPKDLSLRCQLRLNTEGMLEVTASEPSGKKVMSTFKLQAL